MNGKRIGKLTLIITVVALLAGGGYYLFTRILFPTQRVSLENALKEIDNQIASGYFSIAAQGLDRLLPDSRRGFDILRIVKRAFQAGALVDNPRWLAGFVNRALEKIPGNRDMRCLAAYALIRSGQIEKGYGLLQNPGQSEVLTLMKTEATLRLGKLPIPSDTDRSLALLFSLIDSRDPSLFLTLGQQEGDNRLLTDAALLYMERGKAEDALRIGAEDLQAEENDELFALIAYDAENDPEAVRRLRRYLLHETGRIDLLMLLADLYLMTGRTRESILIFRRLIQQDGSPFSVTAFTNLAWALATDGRIEEALEVLRDGTAVFPVDSRLVFEMAKYLFHVGRDVEARGLLVDFLKNHPGNQRMALGLLRMEWTSLRPERFLSDMWRLYSQDPDNESLCRYLVWYLLGLKDYRSAIIALDLYNRGGEPAGEAWYYHYGGLLQALSGRYDRALELMNRSIKTGEAFDSLYNRAVLYRKIGNFTAAKEDLLRAVILADQSGQEPSMRSRIHTEIAQVLLAEDNRDGARRELLYALDLENGNEKASFLLRELEK